MSNPYVKTHSGLHVDLLDPKPDQISIDDIAYSLGNICRFNGHTSQFHSVAQHGCLVEAQIASFGEFSAEERLAALLHDAHEAYLGDVSRPLRRVLGQQYINLVDKHQEVILRTLGLTLDYSPRFDRILRLIDSDLCWIEAEQLMGGAHDIGVDKPDWSTVIISHPPREATSIFLGVFYDLLDLMERERTRATFEVED